MWDRRTCVRAHGRDTCELYKSRREHAISCYYLILLSVDIVSKALYEIKITTFDVIAKNRTITSNLGRDVVNIVVIVMWDRRTCVRAHGRDTCELYKSRREHAISCYYLILLSVDIVSKALYEIKITTYTKR